MTVRDLFLVAFAALGLAIAMWLAALHTAKAVARAQVQRIEQVERSIAEEEGR